ncbi:MAG: hypothetical protein HY399_02200 [Elusimicrobia bacterium]|nr:hypothetical protein [Elusimicrobiota bacterium]
MPLKFNRILMALVFLNLVLIPGVKSASDEKKTEADKIFETYLNTPSILFMGQLITPKQAGVAAGVAAWGALHATPALPVCATVDVALGLAGCGGGGGNPVAPPPPVVMSEVACYNYELTIIGSSGLASLLCAGSYDSGETAACYSIARQYSSPTIQPSDASLLCSGSTAWEATTGCYNDTPANLGVTDSALLCSGYDYVDSKGAPLQTDAPTNCYFCTPTDLGVTDSSVLCSGAAPVTDRTLCSLQEPVNCYDAAVTVLSQRDASVLCSANWDSNLGPIDCYNDSRLANLGVRETALLCAGVPTEKIDAVIDCFQRATTGSDFGDALLCSGTLLSDNLRPLRCFDSAYSYADRATLCSARGELGAYAASPATVVQKMDESKQARAARSNGTMVKTAKSIIPKVRVPVGSAKIVTPDKKAGQTNLIAAPKRTGGPTRSGRRVPLR